MKNKCIIVTSNSIEGATITEYLGLVSANVVLGVNAIDDFFASFSDFFGGHSGAYQKQMTNLFNEAVEKLSFNASLAKADAVIAVKVDFDEISGKGKQMFMVTMTGTAVKLGFECNLTTKIDEVDVSQTDLEEQLIRERITELFNNRSYNLRDNEWQFLKAHDGDIFREDLIRKSIEQLEEAPLVSQAAEDFVKNYKSIFDNLSPEEQSRLFYYCYKINSTQALAIHSGSKVFSAKEALELIPSDFLKEREVDNYLKMINLPSKSYTEGDLSMMEQILEHFHSAPIVWTIEERSKLLGGKVMKVVCSCGTSFDEGVEMCPNQNCRRNNKGFTLDQRCDLEKFEKKVSALRTLFSMKNKLGYGS